MLLAVAIVMLTPLPSLRELAHIDIPVGLDPVNILVLLGVVAAWLRVERSALLGHTWIFFAGILNLELLLIAWYRTYGPSLTLSSFALFAHSVVVFLAGPTVIQCLSRSRATRVAGLSMAALIGVVGLSVVAEAGGIYDPPVDRLSGPLLVKPNGGIMLQANEAGALIATFAVPAALLLKEGNHRRLAYGLVAACVPVLIVTRSRESLVVFSISLLAAAALEARRLFVAGSLVGIVSALSLAAIAAPEKVSDAIEDPNAFLSGRLTLWDAAVEFLDAGRLWLNGGGLHAYEAYVRAGPLGHSFTTHNQYLRLLVDGGAIMLGAWILLLIVLWLAGRSVGGAEGRALQVAVVATAILGLAKDNGPFTRGSAWIWLLAALVATRRLTSQNASRLRKP